jgi:hypothetical protein
MAALRQKRPYMNDLNHKPFGSTAPFIVRLVMASMSIAKKPVHALLGLRAAHESPDAFNFSLRTARLLVNCKANAVLRDLLCIGGKIRRSGYDLSRGPTEICCCEPPLNEADALGLAPPTISPLRIIRAAMPSPQSRVKRCVPPAPGSNPTFVFGNPNFAVCNALRISQAKASSRPPPRAWPSISAIVTKGSAAR